MSPNSTELLRAVTFLAPPVTYHQADRIWHYLFGKGSDPARIANNHSSDLKQIQQKLEQYDLHYINLIQASYITECCTESAYRDRDDRVLHWLHDLSIVQGRAMLSNSKPMAEISAISVLIHYLDEHHAQNRHEIETYRIRLSVLAELVKMGRNDLADRIDCLFAINHAPDNIDFGRDFNQFAWHVAKSLVAKADGGKKDV
jgi:hypothetical protein